MLKHLVLIFLQCLELFSYFITVKQCCTCFCDKVQRAESWLVVRGAEVQADGEGLTSPHDQTVHAVQVSAMVGVVEKILEVPAFDVQSFRRGEQEIKKTADQYNTEWIVIREISILFGWFSFQKHRI